MLRSSWRTARSANSLYWSLRRATFWIPMSSQESLAIRGVEALRKRDNQGGRPPKRQRYKRDRPKKAGSNDEVLLADVEALLASQRLADLQERAPRESANEPEFSQPTEETLPTPLTEIDVKIVEISSNGDGLALSPNWNHVYVVPFTAPGDVVRVKVIRHFPDDHHSLADFLQVIEPSHLRDDSRINCKYFAACSGCQFQMLDYPTQLEHKKAVIEKAYKNFSKLSPSLIPAVGDTMGSPLKYGYRTKLTPHFDGPPGYRSRIARRNGINKVFEEIPDIGFQKKGQRKTLDIEDCPIGTNVVRLGMKRERIRVAAELEKFKKGATLLLRESTQRISKFEANEEKDIAEAADTVKSLHENYTDLKTCITDNNATSTEYVDSFIFKNPAGSFFQNNNSILPSFTQYIRDHIFPPVPSDPIEHSPKIKYLIDAYCGSGLFTITLSSLFASSTGIDISDASITYACKNAELNNISPSQATFIAADAPQLFKSVSYPPDETVVVIDPPRKGCDDNFLNQLLKFAPSRVVYVSCNVHTQAGDVGVLVRGEAGVTYAIESLIGFDFFPQTSHVEGVAVLSRVDSGNYSASTTH